MADKQPIITKRNVKSFLDNEIKDFAKYVIETRALPNIMDGQRIGARKILWAALNGDLKSSSKVKMPNLIGSTMFYHYNHGDAALMNTIVQLCSTHINKYCPLDVIGQIGSLRVPKSDTAPRYLHVKKTKYLDFFKQDMELLEIQHDDGDKVEPKFFLPIIPLALLNRTNSPGFGFSYRSFSYNINDIIDNCIKSINFGTCNEGIYEIPLRPHVEGIKPENMIYNHNKNSWYNVGEYTMDYDKDMLIITDLPYDISFEILDSHLHDLLEKNYIIKFTDISIDGKIKYVIQFAKGRLKLLSQDQWKFFQTMKLFSKLRPDTLNFMDIDGKTILSFQNSYELIDFFIQRRLKFYEKRKIHTINVINSDIRDLSNKIKFITLILNEELIINKRPIEDIKKDLVKYNLPNECLKLSISRLTKEEIQKAEQELSDLNKYLEYIKITPIKEMYINDLIEFKRKYSEIIKM